MNSHIMARKGFWRWILFGTLTLAMWEFLLAPTIGRYVWTLIFGTRGGFQPSEGWFLFFLGLRSDDWFKAIMAVSLPGVLLGAPVFMLLQPILDRHPEIIYINKIVPSLVTPLFCTPAGWFAGKGWEEFFAGSTGRKWVTVLRSIVCVGLLILDVVGFAASGKDRWDMAPLWVGGLLWVFLFGVFPANWWRLRKKSKIVVPPEALIADKTVPCNYTVSVTTFKAAVMHECGRPQPFAQSKPFTIEECELEAPRAEEVLVRIRAASLCHSDLSVVDGSRPRVMPMVLGHEAAGEVVETGPGVADLKAGDRVVCVFVPHCGHCVRCQEGRPALCEQGAAANLSGTLLNGGRRLRLKGKPVHHHLGVSGFAEYAVLSRSSLVKLPADLPFETAALFGCAIITGVGAVLNTANVPAGSTVAVVGAGGVGLSCVLGAVLAGAGRILAVDLNQRKLQLAREFGATDVFDAAADNVVATVKEATGGGVDFAFETAGAAPALALAYQMTRRGGTTVTAGLPNPNHQFSIPQISLTAEERTLKGSYMGSCVPKRDIPNYIALFRRGKLPVERLVTHRIQLSEINEGFDLLASGDAGRILMTP